MEEILRTTWWRHHRTSDFLSPSPPIVYRHHPIQRTNPSAILTSKMLSITRTRRHSSFDREPMTKKRMAHREFSVAFHPASLHQHQRTQSLTNNTPRNTKNARCAENAHQPPVPSPQPRPYCSGNCPSPFPFPGTASSGITDAAATKSLSSMRTSRTPCVDRPA